jgi:acyl carrier protein
LSASVSPVENQPPDYLQSRKVSKAAIREFTGATCYAWQEIAMDIIAQQLKEIIITGLRIKDRTPEDLSDDEPLLGGDLEIDSIDILQLILEIERRFGIKLVDGEFDESAWQSIRTLAVAVEAKVAAKQ